MLKYFTKFAICVLQAFFRRESIKCMDFVSRWNDDRSPVIPVQHHAIQDHDPRYNAVLDCL